MSEQAWMERAQSAEGKIASLTNAVEAANERLQSAFALFGIKAKMGGAFSIDYAMLVANLGPDQCQELRKIMDEKFGAPTPTGGAVTVACPVAAPPLKRKPGRPRKPKVPEGYEVVGYSDAGKPRIRIKAGSQPTA
jgi:hypothetical protein